MPETKEPRSIIMSLPSFVGMALAIISLLCSMAFGYASYTAKLDNTVAIVQQQAMEQKELKEELVRVRIAIARLEFAVNNNTASNTGGSKLITVQ